MNPGKVPGADVSQSDAGDVVILKTWTNGGGPGEAARVDLWLVPEEAEELAAELLRIARKVRDS